MTIPPVVFGLGGLILGLLLTFGFPIQRGRYRNQIWDLLTLALFVVAGWGLAIWDPLSNLAAGLIVGLAAVVIRDFRLWLARFHSQSYRRSHRYYWYGRARNWYGGRRRRRSYR
ncbi:MAG: hypothetical protein IT318_11470 [Anaerolineales bacterium]|nr:hypothetical protein [Anaerolineales bacterium]